MSNLGATLKSMFLSDGSVRWGDVGEALIGGLIFQLATGLAALPLSIAEGISQFIGDIVSALEGAVGAVTVNAGADTIGEIVTASGGIAGALLSEAGATWDPFSAGIFSWTLNAIVILGAIYVAARGWEVIQGG